ncbi:unnamed protein product [Lampetra fluviatilis]
MSEAQSERLPHRVVLKFNDPGERDDDALSRPHSQAPPPHARPAAQARELHTHLQWPRSSACLLSCGRRVLLSRGCASRLERFRCRGAEDEGLW